jgi:hypothetical protein
VALATIPPLATLVLDAYRRLLDERAPGLVDGLYLHGSVALGAWVEGKSDLDFVAILARPADKRDLAALDLVHREVARVSPRPEMQGAYLRRQDLHGTATEVAPHPAYSDGRLRLSTRSGLCPVDRWLLSERGVTVFGADLEARDLDVCWDEVAGYMADNLQTYWAAWLTSPRRLAYLLVDDGVEWAVLGVCRLLYGLEEKSLVSKLEAGEHALIRLPTRWHALLREAIDLRLGRLRLGKAAIYYRSRIARALETRAFLRYVVEKQWR